jgi:hypothetical protein
VDFIFMLTRDDRTVEDCLAAADDALALGLKHIGFKDIGAAPGTLRSLNARIKGAGATSYMEVVSTSSEDTLRSAAVAVEIGVDRLLGGTDVDAILRTIEGAEIAYYPFPGFPVGHPTRLGGNAAEIAAHCAAFSAKGCAGADLLAYRATAADPLDLVRAARHALGRDRQLIVAGSVNSAERIAALREAGADAFTIGSAVFDGSFSPRNSDLRAQLQDVLAACAAAAARVA